MKSRTEILVPLAAIQAVPIAVIAWYRLHRYAWYRYSAIVKSKDSASSKTISYIFYFGDLNYNSFKLLKSAFSKTVGWDTEKEIFLYVYDADDEFRKIENDIKERIFDQFTITIKRMVKNINVPDYIVNGE